ncbi:hypothetical protein PQD71_gp230 [Kosakonia phage Kc263]|uniref:Uncharacterized protein n=1 Tax=Kosakonia phage Kc263 TaxID=2863194 RepID=A0AAE7WFE4_9CAUD|nr:hypothetical protein PQD71_gp230 [Kosakonia phage Kc263]QYN80096.1 hypothetical protein [Kosakonia phage Kc263]
MSKATEVQYPISGLTPSEQEITDKMVSEIGDLIKRFGDGNKLPLADAVKIMGKGLYVILHMNEDRESEPDVEAVIKANVPDAIIKHGIAIRQPVNGHKLLRSDIQIPYGPDNILRQDLFLSRMTLVITEDKEVVLLRGRLFPVSARFTI